MDVYEVEVEPAEPDGFAAIVPAVPGLLVLDSLASATATPASGDPSLRSNW